MVDVPVPTIVITPLLLSIVATSVDELVYVIAPLLADVGGTKVGAVAPNTK